MKSYLVLLLSLILAGCAGQTVSPTDKSTQGAAEAYTQLGMQYLRNGDAVNAKSAFQRASEIDKNAVSAYNGLAMAFQIEQEPVLAEQYFEKAISIAPDSAMLRNNFGAFLFSQERYPEACKQLGRATEDPFYNRRAQAFENLGRCYLLIDRSDAAEHAFERSLKLNPGRVLPILELSALALEKDDIELAVTYFEQFSQMVDAKQIDHNAKSLWLGVQIARIQNKAVNAATYGLILKNLYPESNEYRQYKESSR